VYRLTWRLPLAGLVAFSHLQFSQIRGRQPYSIVRKIPYLIVTEGGQAVVAGATVTRGGASSHVPVAVLALVLTDVTVDRPTRPSGLSVAPCKTLPFFLLNLS
jgi:hypothetical protein